MSNSNISKRKADRTLDLERQADIEPVEAIQENQVPKTRPMSALATAAVQAEITSHAPEDTYRPIKKAKAASNTEETTVAVEANKTSDASEEHIDRPTKKAKAASTEGEAGKPVKDAIKDALDRLSKPSTLSDYEKCSIFPQKLMQLLRNEEAPDAIWWLEDGESFAIEQEQFTKVMNKVSRTSKKMVKLDSILRNLYRWGFKKLKDRDLPPNVLAYSHPKFKRDCVVELQTFSKKSDTPPGGGGGSGGDGLVPPPTALARALSARAQAGYGDNWNEEGAADKTTLMMNNYRHSQEQQAGQFSILHYQQQQQQQQQQQLNAMMPDQRMMFMLQQQHQQQYHHHQQQQQQRQMLLQQELMLHEQQQRHQQMLLEAAAAEQYAAATAAGFPHHYPPTNPYPF